MRRRATDESLAYRVERHEELHVHVVKSLTIMN
jgi:hypothetical protein